MRLFTVFFACMVGLPAQPTLREMGAQRALLMGTAASADELGRGNLLDEPAYAATLSAQYNMLSPENALKWTLVHPAQNTYNFDPGDQLVAFAESNEMRVRGHTLCWYTANPSWLKTLARTATPATMAQVLRDHVTTLVTRYRGRVFAWDVVNEAVSDSATGNIATDLQDSIWYNQPGIGLGGTGYIEQAFRWAHEADPSALLFYNDYGIEAPGPKFQAVYSMVKDFVSRGVPIHGVGLQMHVGLDSYPTTAGLAQNIRQLTALGLQVHITEMDVRVPVDANGQPLPSDLQLQADKYKQILTVCLQNPGCTGFQTWQFSDKYSWIPYYFLGMGAALPFDSNCQPKPAFSAMIQALQTVPPPLSRAAIVNAASRQSGSLAPGEYVTILNANYGPVPMVGVQLDFDQPAPTNLAGTQVFFNGIAAPVIYSTAGEVGAIVPYAIAGRRQTTVQYAYNGVKSVSATVPVAASAPGVFAVDGTGQGPGYIFNQDGSANTSTNPASSGSGITLLGTGGGKISGGAVDGAVATGTGSLILSVTATVGGVPATVIYVGPSPGRVNGVVQVELLIPGGLAPGPQPVVVTVGGVASQIGITVFVG